MFFRSIFSLLSASLLFLAANTAPLAPRSEFLAVAPKVTSPTANSVWETSSKQTVEWDTSNIPEEAKNYNVTIYLGHWTSNPDSENLDLDEPLAQNVPIMAGSYDVTVPKVTPGNNYLVVVDGDSGNASDQFEIVQSLQDTIGSML